MAKSFKEFIAAIFHDFIAGMSGIFSVVLMTLAYIYHSDFLRLLFAPAAVVCLLIASFRVWEKEHKEVARLSESKKSSLEIREYGSSNFAFVCTDSTLKNCHHVYVSLGIRLENTGDRRSNIIRYDLKLASDISDAKVAYRDHYWGKYRSFSRPRELKLNEHGYFSLSPEQADIFRLGFLVDLSRAGLSGNSESSEITLPCVLKITDTQEVSAEHHFVLREAERQS